MVFKIARYFSLNEGYASSEFSLIIDGFFALMV